MSSDFTNIIIHQLELATEPLKVEPLIPNLMYAWHRIIRAIAALHGRGVAPAQCSAAR